VRCWRFQTSCKDGKGNLRGKKSNICCTFKMLKRV
jgi:hypothetical protein